MFRKIDNYPDYEVNRRGVVRHAATKNLLKPWIDGCGLISVSLRHPYGVSRQEFVHKLVWRAFKGEIPQGLYVHFKNRKPDDINLSNLELGTRRGGTKPQPRYELDFAKIFRQHGKGKPLKEIAADSKIPVNYVKSILYGPCFAVRREDFAIGRPQRPHRFGCRGPRRKLTDRQAVAVRTLSEKGVSYDKLANAFEVSTATIGKCVRRSAKCYAS